MIAEASAVVALAIVASSPYYYVGEDIKHDILELGRLVSEVVMSLAIWTAFLYSTFLILLSAYLNIKYLESWLACLLILSLSIGYVIALGYKIYTCFFTRKFFKFFIIMRLIISMIFV